MVKALAFCPRYDLGVRFDELVRCIVLDKTKRAYNEHTKMTSELARSLAFFVLYVVARWA